MAAARSALGRRPVRAAARLALILLLAAGLAALTVIAAPARAGDGASGPVTALLGAAPASATGFTPSLIAPLGEELRGNDHGMDWRHCVQVVANLRAKKPEVPLVVLLGGSSARECTVLDDEWERQIERRQGYVVDAYNLAPTPHLRTGPRLRQAPADQRPDDRLHRRQPRQVLPPGEVDVDHAAAAEAAVALPAARLHQGRIQSYSLKRYYVSYWLRPQYPEFRANFASAELGPCCGRSSVSAGGAPPRRAGRPAPRPGGPSARRSTDPSRATTRTARASPGPGTSRGCTSTRRPASRDRDFFDIFHLVEPGRVKYQSILSARRSIS